MGGWKVRPLYLFLSNGETPLQHYRVSGKRNMKDNVILSCLEQEERPQLRLVRMKVVYQRGRDTTEVAQKKLLISG